jgi:uncharacterized protein YbaR (Trm112 family)
MLLPDFSQLSLGPRRRAAPTDALLGDAQWIDMSRLRDLDAEDPRRVAFETELNEFVERNGLRILECPICLGRLDQDTEGNPWTGQGSYLTQGCTNAHIFHKSCLKGVVDTERNPRCPDCREPLLVNVVESLRDNPAPTSVPQEAQPPVTGPAEVVDDSTFLAGRFWVPGPPRWHFDLMPRMLRGMALYLDRHVQLLGEPTEADGNPGQTWERIRAGFKMTPTYHELGGNVATMVQYEILGLTNSQKNRLVTQAFVESANATDEPRRVSMDRAVPFYQRFFNLEGPPKLMQRQVMSTIHQTWNWSSERPVVSNEDFTAWEAAWPQRSRTYRALTYLLQYLNSSDENQAAFTEQQRATLQHRQ